MLDGQLIARKSNDDPPSYRVSFDDGTGPVDVGWISEHMKPLNAPQRMRARFFSRPAL